MSLDDRNSPKLLVIVSAAFGELFMANYFVSGSAFPVVFALCDAHFGLNYAGLPGRTHRYGDLADLLSIVEEESPQVVCMFSGYLLVHDRLLDQEGLDRFVEELLRRGIKVVTSDPFLGMASRFPYVNPKNPLEQILSLPFGLVGELLFGSLFPYLMRMGSSLKRVAHLYVVDPDEPGDVRRLMFFNPNIRRKSQQEGDRARVSQRDSGDWLFILANSEYRPLIDGVDSGFVPLLAEKLRETLEEGRRPVLIAPKACIDILTEDVTLRKCVFLTNCDYNRYLSLLLGAEYVFYWNIFSASVIAPILNGVPTFFFGQGHVAEAHKLMYEKGLARYYANAKLTHLDQTNRLKQSELATHAVLQETQLFEPFYRNMCGLPAPDDVLRQLLEA
jgi:hypothetical protein